MRDLVMQNRMSAAMVLFLMVFGAIHYLKPTPIYNLDGSLRDFGVGFKNQTVVPMWLVAVFLGILCYVAVQWYVDL